MPCVAMVERMISSGPWSFGLAAAAEAAVEYARVVVAPVSGVEGGAEAKMPSWASRCTCIRHLTSSMGVLGSSTEREGSGLLGLGKLGSNNVQEETRSGARRASCHRQFTQRQLPPTLGVCNAINGSANGRPHRKNDVLEFIIREEQACVLARGADERSGDALFNGEKRREDERRSCGISTWIRVARTR